MSQSVVDQLIDELPSMTSLSKLRLCLVGVNVSRALQYSQSLTSLFLADDSPEPQVSSFVLSPNMSMLALAFANWQSLPSDLSTSFPQLVLLSLSIGQTIELPPVPPSVSDLSISFSGFLLLPPLLNVSRFNARFTSLQNLSFVPLLSAQELSKLALTSIDLRQSKFSEFSHIFTLLNSAPLLAGQFFGIANLFYGSLII